MKSHALRGVSSSEQAVRVNASERSESAVRGDEQFISHSF
jgi:hypothetical protein